MLYNCGALMECVLSVAVCPAGWKPGADTIKPNVSQSKDFFAKKN